MTVQLGNQAIVTGRSWTAFKSDISLLEPTGVSFRILSSATVKQF
jgi:hypothetical protein